MPKAKKYGPVDWSPELLKVIYKAPDENDDEKVTEETVERWKQNAKDFAARFRDDHIGLVTRDDKK